MNTQRGTLNAQKDGINNLGFAQQWTLSQTGNWDAFNEDADGNETWDLEQTRTHNLANEINTITATTGPVWADPDHDEAGNMTTMPKPYDLTESYTAVYDAWNRLIELIDDDTSETVAAYRYNGEHRRIVGQTYEDGTLAETRYFHHSVQWQVIEERVDVGSNASEGDVERQFLWGLEYVDELVVRFRDTTGNQDLDEIIYALHDANYRITAIISDAGSVLERYFYSPYGQRTVLNSDFTLHSDPTLGSYEFRYGHQGLRHDPETGLVYNRNRMLHPKLGRFVQTDPLGYADGMNMYAYLRSSPVVYFDPIGLLAEPDWGDDDPLSPYLGTDDWSHVGAYTDLAVHGTTSTWYVQKKKGSETTTDVWYSTSTYIYATASKSLSDYAIGGQVNDGEGYFNLSAESDSCNKCVRIQRRRFTRWKSAPTHTRRVFGRITSVENSNAASQVLSQFSVGLGGMSLIPKAGPVFGAASLVAGVGAEIAHTNPGLQVAWVLPRTFTVVDVRGLAPDEEEFSRAYSVRTILDVPCPEVPKPGWLIERNIFTIVGGSFREEEVYASGDRRPPL